MTPKRIKEIQEIADVQCSKALHDCLHYISKLQTLEKTLRTIVEDEDYDAGGLGCHQNCHTNYARGSEKPACDCYVKEVMAALRNLKT